MRFDLIPISYGRHVVLQGKVGPIFSPAQILNGHPQVAFKSNGINNVPAIETKPLLRLVESIRFDYLRQPRIWSGELLVLFLLLVFKIVRTVEVVLGAGAVNR